MPDLARFCQTLAKLLAHASPPNGQFLFILNLLFAAQSRQEPTKNPISKLCLHRTNPKSDFEQPSQENARFLLPQATPKSLPKPTQIEKFGAGASESIDLYGVMSPYALASCPQLASTAIQSRFWKHFGSISEAFSKILNACWQHLAFNL